MTNETGGRIIRYIPACVALLLFTIFTVLYIQEPRLYFLILNVWSFEVYKQPFIDSFFLYNMKKCWLEGVNIYQSIPCDIVPGNRMPYSPLWPRLPFLPSDAAVFGLPVAILTNILAILSTLILPAVRTKREALILTLTLASPPIVFAFERNNIDVWMYLILCGVVLLSTGRSGSRFFAYGLAIVSGLLKYYPMVWLILALREKLALAAAIAMLALLCLGGLIWAFWPELLQGLANVTRPDPIVGMMSVLDIPRGLMGDTAERVAPAGPFDGMIIGSLRLAITLYIVIGACKIGASSGLRDWLSDGGERNGIWLVAGCVTIAGCYLAGPNLPYREIFMLMVIAPLLVMTRAESSRNFATARLNLWPVLILALMWAKVVDQGLGSLLQALALPDIVRGKAVLLVWLVEKVAWILVIRFFLAIVVAWILNSRAFSDLQDFRAPKEGWGSLGG